MGDKTAIEWTDATWNPTVGCSIVSPGCTNCYAMKTAAALERRFGSAKYAGLTKRVNGNDVWTGDVRLDEGALDQPLRWRRPRRIFVNSMSDLFHERLTDDAIDRVFAVMALCPQHTFQVLTKRARRLRDYLAAGPKLMDRIEVAMGKRGRIADWPLPNVWLGVSVEDQARADERIPLLLKTPAAVRFLSCEPLLGPTDLRPYLIGEEEPGLVGNCIGWTPPLDWVIAGGESGPGARPMDVAWVRSLLEQCRRYGVACFVKQLGALAFSRRKEPSFAYYTIGEGSYEDGPFHPQFANRKGGDWSEWPADLRVREFPAEPDEMR